MFAALTAFLAASLAASIVGAGAIVIILLLAGGFTVYLYRKNFPATPVPTRLGARMGWVTGLYAFAMFLIATTVEVLAKRESISEAVLRDLERQSAQNPAMKEAFASVDQATLLAMFLVVTLIFSFITCTTLSSLGGALTAHFKRARD